MLVNVEANPMTQGPPIAKPNNPLLKPEPLPLPLAWTKEEDLKWKVIAGKVLTAIADAGCTTNCDMEVVSDCG